MNISKEQIDNLNAVVKVAITKEDYEEKVNENRPISLDLEKDRFLWVSSKNSTVRLF